MKKLTAVILAVMVLVGSAVPALAAINIGTVPLTDSSLGKAGCVVVEDGVSIIQTLQIANPQIEVYRQAYDLFLAAPNDRKVILLDNYNKNIRLGVVSEDWYSYNPQNGSVSIKFQSYVQFSFLSGSGLLLPNAASLLAGQGTIFSVSGSHMFLLFGAIVAQDIADGTAKNPRADFLQYFPSSGQLGWRDDIEDEPSEPEPPTPSEPEPEPIPPWTPGGTPPPTTGNTSPYVPYDVSVWDDFIAYLRTASGSATNIIMLIMIPFIIVPLIISIIKHFASGGKNGGGGKTV